jgi:hypothetical protein
MTCCLYSVQGEKEREGGREGERERERERERDRDRERESEQLENASFKLLLTGFFFVFSC